MAKYRSVGGAVAAPVSELLAIPGLGTSGAAALKLIQVATVNMLRKEVDTAPLLSSWDQLIDYLTISLQHDRIERFHVLFLDHRNSLIADEVLGSGTIDHVPVFPREIVRRCLDLHATAIILVHNHPTGDPTPSQADITMTKDIERAAALMGICLHDHIIVGRFGYRSLRQEQLL